MNAYERQFKEDYDSICALYQRLSEQVQFYDKLLDKPKSPKDLLEVELDALYNLIKILETRANTEGIAL